MCSHSRYCATHCNALQHTATKTLQRAANVPLDMLILGVQSQQVHCNTLQHTATHCKTLQHSATLCNTLQHTATHCNRLQQTHCNKHTATYFNGAARYAHSRCAVTAGTLQHTTTHCNTLQNTATHCNTLQHIHCNTYTATNSCIYVLCVLICLSFCITATHWRTPRCIHVFPAHMLIWGYRHSRCVDV